MPELLGVRDAARKLDLNPSTVSRYLKKHPDLNRARRGERPKVDPEEYARHAAENINGAMSGNHAGLLLDAAGEDPDTGGPTYAQAKATREAILARRAQIDLDEKLGNLVPRDEMERAFFTCARVVRQKIDQIETWADPLAALAGCEAQAVRGFLREQIRKIETELSESLKALPGQDEDEDEGGRESKTEETIVAA